MRLLLAFLASCATARAPAPSGASGAGDAAAGVSDPELAQILFEQWEANLASNPIWATQLGDHRYDDRIADISQAAIDRDRAARRAYLERAKAIPADRLSESDRVTRALFIEWLEDAIAAEACRFEKWSLSTAQNPVREWNELPDLHPITTPQDGRNYVARLDAAPRSIDVTIGHLEEGAAAGWYANRETTRRVLEMTDTLLAKPTAEWAMASPAKKDPALAPEVLRAAEALRPAYQRYRTFLAERVLPNARGEDRSGLGALPFGSECYASRIAEFTTLPLDAKTIHETGVAEIERINGEMRSLGEELFGTSDLGEILGRLRTDRSLYFESAEQVKGKAEHALAAAAAAIPKYFGVLPKAPCVVRPIPDYEAPFTTVAYYRQPVPDGSKPGEYFINIYQPETRPRYEAEALAFHESIPGHHLQIAISQELPELPAFRKHEGMTVFVEGWALYTERLAVEMGLYSSSLDRMGMLSFEAWRASRLVVDTGIHAMGWSRAQAKAYMEAHTGLAQNNIDNEVDRYIVWPGQALAYKTGQMEIWRLRRDAEAALGDRFDLRAFHDVVLTGGAVSLELLRGRVASWIDRVKAS
jgi:uncharacterized protein (DUF885 family)